MGEPVTTTSDDHSVYAERLAEGRGGWAAMCTSVFGAGKHRLAHLGLARPSRASRRFARVNLLLLAFAVGIAVFANAGWHTVYHGPRIELARQKPFGEGWWRAVENQTGKVGPVDRLVAVELWWNPPAAAVNAAVAVVVAMIAFAVLIRLIERGARRAVGSPPGQPPRFRCAIQYATAWCALLLIAAVPMVLRPLARIGRVAEWSVSPARSVYDVPAVLIVLAGVLLWWFWLIRLGETVPREARRPVNQFFVFWVPVLTMVVLGGATWGALALAGHLIRVLNLAW
jgi:hypothetical protein